jgi:hypothetical protein
MKTDKLGANDVIRASLSWMLTSKGVPKRKIKLLLAAKDQIAETWSQDGQGTKGFPLSTMKQFSMLRAALTGKRPRRDATVSNPIRARTFADLLPEDVVEQVHEYLYEQPWRDALDQLNSDETRESAFARLRHTVNVALDVIHYGNEALPAPRGNWLHRQILGIVLAIKPAKFTDSEMAELFKYFCPCGDEHTRDIIKKFRWRFMLRTSGKRNVKK